MAVDSERYPAPATERAKRRRRVKRLLIGVGVLLALTIVALELWSIIDPPRIYNHG